MLTLWESDPSSGESFRYRWSRDACALQIDGRTAGFERHGALRNRTLCLVYLVDGGRLFDLPDTVCKPQAG